MTSLYKDRGNIKQWLMVVLLCLGLIAPGTALAQGSIIVNLAALDGLALTPQNVLGYSLQSNLSATYSVRVKGSIRYRQNGLWLSYSFRTSLRPGLNNIDARSLRPEWSYSSNALRELFQDYQILPQGTYEYCVTVTPEGSNGELVEGEEATECLYHKADDLFLINLIDPEDKAELYEHYPVFSWMVNYPFASQLTYRIRVAEIKEGQNTANAVVRNNPVYTESNLPQTATTYPAYATPLKTFQDYAWTVDAFYKGILLGGAEPWKFRIVEDSTLIEVARDQPYYDFVTSRGASLVIAVGDLKLKYISSSKEDTLSITIRKAGEEKVAFTKGSIPIHFADNPIAIDCRYSLRHNTRYVAGVKLGTGAQYQIPFIYYNPLFIR